MKTTSTRGILREIARSRRETTILFTDIKDSTRLWSNKGDVEARLLLDRHNRLAFPVVRRFRRRLIKTIGDAIMAAFRRPEDAIRAAVCLQQLFDQERRRDVDFKLHVRIGIHTGKALVEHNDVFGDAVNVASRVESRAEADEILVSGSTMVRVRNTDCKLSRKERFKPKGKSHEITVYNCDWRRWPSLTVPYYHERLPLAARQKIELLGYLGVAVATLVFIYHNYLRYLLADNTTVALLYLDPLPTLDANPWLWAPAGLLFVLAVRLFLRLRSMPHTLLRLIKGGFGFGLAFAAAWLLFGRFELPREMGSDDIIHASDNLFVQVVADGVSLHAEPDRESQVLGRLEEGDFLLLADVQENGDSTWNKVLIDTKSYGWVERITPARLGEAQVRLTQTDKFYFRRRDSYLLAIGLLGFLRGFLGFRLRPM